LAFRVIHEVSITSIQVALDPAGSNNDKQCMAHSGASYPMLDIMGNARVQGQLQGLQAKQKVASV
jgi:hypothetical protein